MRSLYPISCLESGERQFAGYIYRQYQRRCFFSGCRVRISSASTPSSLLPFADPRSHRSSVALVLRHQHQQYPRRNRKLDQPLSSAFPLLFSFRAEHILHFDRRAPLLRPITHTGRIMGPRRANNRQINRDCNCITTILDTTTIMIPSLARPSHGPLRVRQNAANSTYILRPRSFMQSVD